MDFFGQQALSKKKIALMMLIFIAGIVAISALFSFTISAYYVYSTTAKGHKVVSWFQPHIFKWTSISVAISSIAFFIYEYIKLHVKPELIAEHMGGNLVYAKNNLYLQRYKNAAEEMSIAAGLSCPKLYVINDESINAFTAGMDRDNAVIAVTTGALERLDREELSAVIAHELGHIANGDVKRNMLILSIIFSLDYLSELGTWLTDSFYFLKETRFNPAMIGLIFIVFGFVGKLFGNLMRALISQESEFAADANSAQYTRNPDALARALQKINGFTGEVDSPYYNSYSFMGLTGFDGFFSTHPPIEERIFSLVKENRPPIHAKPVPIDRQYEAQKITKERKHESKEMFEAVTNAIIAGESLWRVEQMQKPDDGLGFLNTYADINNMSSLFMAHSKNQIKVAYSTLKEEQIAGLIIRSISLIKNDTAKINELYEWIIKNINNSKIPYVLFAYAPLLKKDKIEADLNFIKTWVQNLNKDDIKVDHELLLSHIYNCKSKKSAELQTFFKSLNSIDPVLEKSFKSMLSKINVTN